MSQTFDLVSRSINNGKYPKVILNVIMSYLPFDNVAKKKYVFRFRDKVRNITSMKSKVYILTVSNKIYSIRGSIKTRLHIDKYNCAKINMLPTNHHCITNILLVDETILLIRVITNNIDYGKCILYELHFLNKTIREVYGDYFRFGSVKTSCNVYKNNIIKPHISSRQTIILRTIQRRDDHYEQTNIIDEQMIKEIDPKLGNNISMICIALDDNLSIYITGYTKYTMHIIRMDQDTSQNFQHFQHFKYNIINTMCDYQLRTINIHDHIIFASYTVYSNVFDSVQETYLMLLNKDTGEIYTSFKIPSNKYHMIKITDDHMCILTNNGYTALFDKLYIYTRTHT
jgi:hypothetical protein